MTMIVVVSLIRAHDWYIQSDDLIAIESGEFVSDFTSDSPSLKDKIFRDCTT